MTHPDRETWVPFIYNETPPEARPELEAHLRECRDCRRQVAEWRRTLARLDRWRIPPASIMPEWAKPALQWAAAAVFILGIGFALGRVGSSPGWDPAEARAALESQLKEQFQRELANAIEDAAAKAAATATNAVHAQWNQLLPALQEARAADREATLAVLEQIRQEIGAGYLSLRRDLETVAALTDTEIRQARQGLFQLAALTRLGVME